jgi:hypothetical protein
MTLDEPYVQVLHLELDFPTGFRDVDDDERVPSLLAGMEVGFEEAEYVLCISALA